jgi:hypothetical protein
MKTDDGPLSPLARALADLPVPALSPLLRARALARARGNLAPSPGAAPRSLLRTLPAYAPSAALLSADAVFLADVCLKLGRIF